MTFRRFIYGVVTAICLLFAVSQTNFAGVVETFRSVRPDTLAYGTVLILASVSLALIRFRVILSYFGFAPSWRDIFVAFAFGQASNMFLLNIVGQSVSRAAVLSRANVPPGVSVIVTYWERILAAAILFALSIIGGWFLVGTTDVDFEIAYAYLIYVFGSVLLVATILAVAILGPTTALAQARRWAGKGKLLWPGALLTLLSQLCMLLAYLVVLMQVSGTGLSLTLVSAIFVIMFASSLPISLSGWGVRELSAVQLLGAVGIGAGYSITAAITIGLISLALLVLFVVLALWCFARRNRPVSPSATDRRARGNSEWTRLAASLVGVATSVLIFFQVPIIINGSVLTANLSDVVALTALGLAAMLAAHKRSCALFPTGFSLSLLAISLLLVLALVLGWSRYGLNQWAVMNRGFGWLVILGYLCAGGALAWAATAEARVLVLRCFALAGAMIALIELVLLFASLFNAPIPAETFVYPLRGYAGNANAFALQMIMTAIAAVTVHRIDPDLIDRKLLRRVLVVVGLATFYSMSRSGIATFGVVLFVIVLFGARAGRRDRLFDVLAPVAAIALALALPAIISAVTASLAETGVVLIPKAQFVASMNAGVSRSYSDVERWQSIVEGWHLWQQHPLFGAGLGAFVQMRLDADLPMLIIHSIPVWLLAEFGVVGFFAIAAIFAGLTMHAFRLYRSPARHAWGLGLLLLLATFGVMGLVHDIFYQRVLWFLLSIFVGVRDARVIPEKVPSANPFMHRSSLPQGSRLLGVKISRMRT